MKPILLLMNTLLLCNCVQLSSSTESMLGAWINKTNGDKVGLKLVDNEHCEMFINQVLKKSSNRACKYEKYEDHYLIFLVGNDGLCGNTPDFQFIYDPKAPIIQLIIGSSEILLQKTD